MLNLPSVNRRKFTNIFLTSKFFIFCKINPKTLLWSKKDTPINPVSPALIHKTPALDNKTPALIHLVCENNFNILP